MAEELFIKSKDTGIVSEKKFDIISLAIRTDGIASVKVNANVDIEISHVKLIVNALEDLGKGKVFPLLIVVGEFTLPTPEARAYIATAEADPYASAEAYVIKSFSQKLVGNVYLSFNKPARPTRLFNDEEKAVEWLKTFL